LIDMSAVVNRRASRFCAGAAAVQPLVHGEVLDAIWIADGTAATSSATTSRGVLL
jgi:hypothetical protein